MNRPRPPATRANVWIALDRETLDTITYTDRDKAVAFWREHGDQYDIIELPGDVALHLTVNTDFEDEETEARVDAAALRRHEASYSGAL